MRHAGVKRGGGKRREWTSSGRLAGKDEESRTMGDDEEAGVVPVTREARPERGRREKSGGESLGGRWLRPRRRGRGPDPDRTGGRPICIRKDAGRLRRGP